MKFLRIIFVLLFLAAFFLPLLPASALNKPVTTPLVPCSGDECTICHIFALLNRIFNFILRDLTPPLAGLMFLWGGILMVVSGGSEERYKKGRQIFTSTLIGVFIVFASWIMVNTLIMALASQVDVAGGFTPGDWYKGLKCR